jgi:hypothetical protein
MIGYGRYFSMIVPFASILSLGCVQATGEDLLWSEGPASDEETIGEAESELNGCNSNDCVKHDLTTQVSCTEVTEGPTFDMRWVKGLNLNVDQTIKGGRIVAFKLQWFNGNWSGWFVPGLNDIDVKYNVGNNTMRRWWSYFYDHTHTYVICK